MSDGGPVPRHARNPRRAYDAEGREIQPATVGSDRAQGDTTVALDCNACHHHVIASTDNMPADLAIPDIPVAYRLRCSRCGSRNVGVMMDVIGFYHRIRGQSGEASALPETYRVVTLRPPQALQPEN